MRGNIFLDFVFLFLICYALISIFGELSDFLLKRYCRYPQKTFLTIHIKHESDTIEYDLRNAISKSLLHKCALLVICQDLDQTENTLIWRLTDCYDHIVLTTDEEVLLALDTATSISVSQ